MCVQMFFEIDHRDTRQERAAEMKSWQPQASDTTERYLSGSRAKVQPDSWSHCPLEKRQQTWNARTQGGQEN